MGIQLDIRAVIGYTLNVLLCYDLCVTHTVERNTRCRYRLQKYHWPDGGRYMPALCTAYRPERSSELHAFLDDPPESLIARGLGRSYGDAAVNKDGAVLDLSRMNRMQRFDAETGVLECEGGVSLAENSGCICAARLFSSRNAWHQIRHRCRRYCKRCSR